MNNSRFLYFICAICVITATVSITMLVQQQKPITTQNTRPKIEYASEEDISELSKELSNLGFNLPSPKISSSNSLDSLTTSSDISSDSSKIDSKIQDMKWRLPPYNYTVTKKEFEKMKDEVKEIKQDIRYLKLRVDQYNSTY